MADESKPTESPKTRYCCSCDEPCQDIDGKSSCCGTPLAWDDTLIAGLVPRPSEDLSAKPRADRRSKYRGVYAHREGGKWRAIVTVRAFSKLLGYYDDELRAAQVVDNALYYARVFGFEPNMRLNFPGHYEGRHVPPIWDSTSRFIDELKARRNMFETSDGNTRELTLRKTPKSKTNDDGYKPVFDTYK